MLVFYKTDTYSIFKVPVFFQLLKGKNTIGADFSYSGTYIADLYVSFLVVVGSQKIRWYLFSLFFMKV